jgi:hypothetical protein
VLIGLDYASKIVVGLTSNGTVIDQRLERLWPHFQSIRYCLSLEATGELYRYIRGGGTYTFEQVIDNMTFFDKFKNLLGTFNVAVQIYNLFSLGDLAAWANGHALQRFTRQLRFTSMVRSPQYLNIQILPDQLKELAVLHLRGYGFQSLEPVIQALQKNYIRDESRAKLFSQFISFTDTLDSLRGEDFLRLRPEFKEFFKANAT